MAPSDPLKLLHFADLHLGVQGGGRLDPATGRPQRIADVCDRFDELCATAEAQGVHAVLFAGDAFNNQHPNPTLQSLFASRVKRLARTGAGVFLLIGNHDLPRTAVFSHPFSIYEALEVEGVMVGDRAQVYRLPLPEGAPARHLQVAALPHFSKQQALAGFGDDLDIDAAIEKRIKRLGDEIDQTLPCVFVGHCHVNQAEVGSTNALFGVSDIEVLLSTLTSGQPFPYYALGHLHKHQILSDEPSVAYAGSLERIDFGEGELVDAPSDGSIRRCEAEPKGFIRFDLNQMGGAWSLAGVPRFLPVRARAFVTLRLGDLDPNDPHADLGKRVGHARNAGVTFDDAMVRIRASLPASDRPRLTYAIAADAIPEAYDIKLSLDAVDAALVRDPRFAEAMTEKEAFDRYLETRADWADDADGLRKLAHDLISEAL